MEEEFVKSLIEQIASQWDGCQYDDMGCLIDIGEAIREAAYRIISEGRR